MNTTSDIEQPLQQNASSNDCTIDMIVKLSAAEIQLDRSTSRRNESTPSHDNTSSYILSHVDYIHHDDDCEEKEDFTDEIYAPTSTSRKWWKPIALPMVALCITFAVGVGAGSLIKLPSTSASAEESSTSSSSPANMYDSDIGIAISTLGVEFWKSVDPAHFEAMTSDDNADVMVSK